MQGSSIALETRTLQPISAPLQREANSLPTPPQATSKRDWTPVGAIPIHLDILDTSGNTRYQVEASLLRIQPEKALITLSALQGQIHWGAQVRFRFGDDVAYYEAFGTIAAYTHTSTSEEPSLASEQATTSLQLVVRLWDIRPAPQQRKTARQTLDIPVRYRPLYQTLSSKEKATEEEVTAQWYSAQAVDLSGGGMRLRIPATTGLPKQVELHFCLPALSPSEGSPHLFRLQGRILRIQPALPNTETREVAIKFENLTIAEGVVLTQYFS